MTRKNWTFFLNMIQRIESLSEYDSKKSNSFFFWIRLNESNPFFECDSNWNFWLKNSQRKIQNWFFSHDPKNRTRFFSIWLKELNLFRLDSKIWCYSVWPKELNFFWLGLTELDPFSWIWLRELNFFLGFLHVYFFQKWCRELNPFFFEYDAKNWTFFSLNVTSRIWRKWNELNPFFLWIWRKEWTRFLFDAKKRTFIFDMNDSKNSIFQTKNTHWIELTFWNMTQRIEHLNRVSKKKDSENGTLLKWFFEMTHRIEPLFFELFQDDSKSWSLFSIWLKELNFFSQNVSKNWTFFFKMLKELNLSFIWTTFWHDSMNWTFFSIRLEELNLF